MNADERHEPLNADAQAKIAREISQALEHDREVRGGCFEHSRDDN